MKPEPVNFLYLGPSKSASTWLYKVLACSPDLFIPTAKDLQFFDVHYNKGIAWYASFFQGYEDKICGEISHDYMLRSNDAMARIAQHVPNAKYICCVRDPFQRAHSGLKFLIRNGLVDEHATIREACADWPELIEGGEYHANLTHVLETVPREQLLILNFDDLERDPEVFATQVFDFLDVPVAGHKFFGKRVNAYAKPRSPLLARVVKKTALGLRSLGLPGVVGRLKTNPLVAKLLYQSSAVIPPMTASDATFLLPVYTSSLADLERDFDIRTQQWVDQARAISAQDKQETL